jgi:hypothetical protein
LLYARGLKLKQVCIRTAMLNLGYAYPPGYASRLQGVHKIKNLLKISPFQSFIYIRPDTNGGLGVRKVLQSCLGGTQRSKIKIWGYASNKRLRTCIRTFQEMAGRINLKKVIDGPQFKEKEQAFRGH